MANTRWSRAWASTTSRASAWMPRTRNCARSATASASSSSQARRSQANGHADAGARAFTRPCRSERRTQLRQRILPQGLAVARRRRPAADVTQHLLEIPFEHQAERRVRQFLESQLTGEWRQRLVVSFDVAPLRRPVGADHAGVEIEENPVEYRVGELGAWIVPCREHGAMSRHAARLDVERLDVEPVQGLRHGHQVDGSRIEP